MPSKVKKVTKEVLSSQADYFSVSIPKKATIIKVTVLEHQVSIESTDPMYTCQFEIFGEEGTEVERNFGFLQYEEETLEGKDSKYVCLAHLLGQEDIFMHLIEYSNLPTKEQILEVEDFLISKELVVKPEIGTPLRSALPGTGILSFSSDDSESNEE